MGRFFILSICKLFEAPLGTIKREKKRRKIVQITKRGTPLKVPIFKQFQVVKYLVFDPN